MNNITEIRDITRHLNVLHEEVRILESRIEPQDCGYLKTTVGTLRSRIKEIQEQLDNDLQSYQQTS
jgi:hypothetical protein|tara:strand:+ start:1851 stop:2048 length:198 start_codon:yes stop_codon:yes gene_type:complete